MHSKVSNLKQDFFILGFNISSLLEGAKTSLGFGRHYKIKSKSIYEMQNGAACNISDVCVCVCVILVLVFIE